MTYEDKLHFLKPTCFMCKRFPFDQVSSECYYRFNRRAHVNRQRCQFGFLAITIEEYDFRQKWRKEKERSTKIQYRSKHREELNEKQRIYNLTHVGEREEYRKKYEIDNAEKIRTKAQLKYQKEKYKKREDSKFRHIIDSCNPIYPVLHMFARYRMIEKHGKKVRTEGEKAKHRQYYHNTKHQSRNIERRKSYQITHREELIEKSLIRRVIKSYDPLEVYESKIKYEDSKEKQREQHMIRRIIKSYDPLEEYNLAVKKARDSITQKERRAMRKISQVEKETLPEIIEEIFTDTTEFVDTTKYSTEHTTSIATENYLTFATHITKEEYSIIQHLQKEGKLGSMAQFVGERYEQ